ncbi:DUF2442 domain-containing protein [Thioflexithrix psekupsensis]|uniref:Integron cassette protein n=1 Tax=Thioflexithrix psekupsensis TaxID=1570016 RepID=A0A251XC73_9GAMM|nr:DUF2442 domain-containing protein [Thioflexithrix psekupsensis]OUD16229.1 integron cassette protein [Thioflexithrix psekupsensis]
MSLSIAGQNILDVEVTNISSHEIWLLTGNKEFFMSYEDFPWFQDATVKDILTVEQPSPNHFYWPNLDIDLSLEIIQNPQHFPLKSCI